jgi:hypothetical protein
MKNLDKTPYFCNLSIPVDTPITLPKDSWPCGDKTKGQLTICESNILSSDVLEFFDKVFPDYCVRSTLLLYYPPEWKERKIHVDGSSKEMIFNFAINWVLSDNIDQYTQWFRANESPIFVENKYKQRYDLWNESQVELIESTNSKGPFVLNTGIPHDGYNPSTNDRWVLSIRFKHKDLVYRPTYQDALTLLSAYIVDTSSESSTK